MNEYTYITDGLYALYDNGIVYVRNSPNDIDDGGLSFSYTSVVGLYEFYKKHVGEK